MHLHRRTVLLLPLLGCVLATADPVTFVDADGVRHGPFELHDQDEVAIGGQRFRVERLSDAAKALEAALRAAQLPAFQFEDAPLADMIQFLRKALATQPPPLSTATFEIVDVPTGLRRAAASFDPSAAPGTGRDASNEDGPVARPAVSISSTTATAWDLLQACVVTTGFRLELADSDVRLIHPRMPDGPLYARNYVVLPTLVDRAIDVRSRRQGDPWSSITQYAQVFAPYGVTWPAGSSVDYQPTLGKLFVVNTIANHRRIEQSLPCLGVVPRQVEIEVQFVSIPRAAIDRIAKRGCVPSEAILKWLDDGTAKVLASPKVITKNGSEATIKGVVEYIYPTEFTVTTTGTSTTDRATAAVTPGGFETREAGVILQVVPDVAPNGTMINLTLTPQTVALPAWRNYAAPVGANANDAARLAPLEQPFFPVESVATSVQIYNGATLVLGGGTPAPDGQSFTYLLVSATLLDPSGRELEPARGMDDLALVPPLLPIPGCVLATADPVTLVDAEGVRHGPFEFRNQSELAIRGQVYTVECAPDESKALIEALRSTPLPPFCFDAAKLADIVQFVREALAKQPAALAKLTIRMIEPTPIRANDVFGEVHVEIGEQEAEGVKQDTTRVLQSESASAWELLCAAAEYSRYALQVVGEEVHLVHPAVPDGPLYRRSYLVVPMIVSTAAMLVSPPPECFCEPPLPDDGYERCFGLFGVTWPAGSSIEYNPQLGRLAVVNTLPNHRRIGDALQTLAVIPAQVEIECQFVSVPKASFDKVTHRGRVTSEQVFRLLEDGTAKVLASPNVITKNGSEATIKGVVEYIYPTEFTVTATGTSTTDRATAAVTPGGFETREAGVILQVVPDVAPSGTLINLTLAPQTVALPAWRNYAVPAGANADDAARLAPLEQPLFPVESVATSVQIYSGTTIVLGGGTPAPDGQSFTYLLVSATLLDPSGRELKPGRSMDDLTPVPPGNSLLHRVHATPGAGVAPPQPRP